MKAQPAPLPAVEWDFAAVPESELVACYLWEFARESQTARDWFAARVKSKTYGQTIEGAYDLLLKEAATKPGTLREAMHALLEREGLGSIRVPDWMKHASEHPGASRVLRHFPNPWQSLPAKDRQRLGACVFKRHNTTGEGLASVVRSSVMFEADAAADFLKSPSVQAEMALVREVPLKGGPWYYLKPFFLENISNEHQSFALLALDWKADDASLIEAFRAWLKTNRPQGQRATKPGHWPRKLRSELQSLGVARALRAHGQKQAPIICPRLAPMFKGERAYIETLAARKAFRAIFHKEKPLFDCRKP